MSAGSRIFIVVLVLAFLGTGLYYLVISDGPAPSSSAIPSVAEPKPQPVTPARTAPAVPAQPIVAKPIASDTVAVRVTVPASDPIGVDLPDRRLRFQSNGPNGVPSGVAEWFPIYDASLFARDAVHQQALSDAPESYFHDRFGMVVEPHEGVLYMLLYTIPSRSVAPSNYRGVDVLSVSEVRGESSDALPELEIAFAESAAKRLNKIGEANLSRTWAVLVDDVVVEIQRITSGEKSSIMITSGFDAAQIKSLEGAIAGKAKIEPSPFTVDGGPVLAEEPTTTEATPVSLAASRTSTVSPGSEPVEAKPVSKPVTKPVKPTMTRYVVKENDTLVSIAQVWFDDSNKWTLIAENNTAIDPNRLSVGQIIMLPPKESEKTTSSTPVSGRTYRVRSGDSLATISRACYGSDGYWKVLYDANKAAIGASPENLSVGTVLTIPTLPKKTP